MKQLPTMSADDDALMTTSAAARLLERSEGTIRNLERIGTLPAVRTTSGQRLFRRGDVLRLLELRRAG
jgi:excisionase family DNA binding protein